MSELRQFLHQPLSESIGVFKCEVVRQRSMIGTTTYKLYYQPTKRLLMLAKAEVRR